MMTSDEQEIYQSFIAQIQDYGLSEEDAQQLFKVSSVLELPTRHILVNQGQQVSHIYFVSKGVCHSSYLTSLGESLSKEFFWEPELILDCEAISKLSPMPYLLETLSPVILICLPIEVIQHWRIASHPLYIKLLEAHLIHKENKERFTLLYTAEQRYQIISQQFPDLIERLSDSHIAAYLGITLDKLSEIVA